MSDGFFFLFLFFCFCLFLCFMESGVKESLRAALAAVQRGSGGYEKAVRVVCGTLARAEAAGPARTAAFRGALFAAVETLVGAPPLDRCVDRCVGFVGALCGGAEALAPGTTEALLARAAALCGAASRAVRQRSAQLIAAVLDGLPDDGTGALDEALYGTLRRALLARVRDRLPAVRVHAVAALARLQDDADAADAAVRAFEALLATDPSPCVRRAVLADIVVTRATLPAVLARTRDAADAVRAAAFRAVAARVDVRSLTPRQRAELVANGLGDRVPAVRRAAADMVRDAWLHTAAHAPALLALLAPEQHPAEALLAAACLEGAPRAGVPAAEALVRPHVLARALVHTGLVTPSDDGGDGDGDDEEEEKEEDEDEEDEEDAQVSAEVAVAWRAHCEALRARGCSAEERRTWFPPVARIVGIVGSGRATVVAGTVLLGAIVELYDEDGSEESVEDESRKEAATAAMAMVASMDTDARLVEPLLQVVAATDRTQIVGGDGTGGLVGLALQLAAAGGEGGGEDVGAQRLERAAQVALFVLCHTDGVPGREGVAADVAQRVALPAVRCAAHAARAAGLRLLAAVCVALAETAADPMALYAYLTVLVDALAHGTGDVPRTVAEGLFDVVMASRELQHCLSNICAPSTTSNSSNSSEKGSSSSRFEPLVARWFRFCTRALGDLEDLELTASVAEGFAKTLFLDLLTPVPRTRAEAVLAQLVVLFHHPATVRPPRLRQCLSVFFPAYVSGPHARAHIALLEAALPQVLRRCTRTDGTLEFAVDVARFVLGLLASAVSAGAGASTGTGPGTGEDTAAAQLLVRVATELGACALAEGQRHGPLCRVYSHALGQCAVEGGSSSAEALSVVRALAEMTAACVDDDALTRRCLTRFVARLGAPDSAWTADAAPFRERAQQLADAVRARSDEDRDDEEEAALPLTPIKKATEDEDGEEDTAMADDDDGAAATADAVVGTEPDAAQRRQQARRRLSHRSSQRPSIAVARNRLSLAQTAAVQERGSDDDDDDDDEDDDKAGTTARPYFDVSSSESEDDDDAMKS